MLCTGHCKPFTWVISARGPLRSFPRGLDAMAVLGSTYAEGVIRAEGDDQYNGYEEQLEKLKQEFDLKREEWTSNLYWNWLYCLKPLLASVRMGLPSFMRSQPWAGKKLYTAFGSWAELRHDTLLYAKVNYTMVATGFPPRPQLTHGYMEPYPELYARIRGMIEQMRKGLTLRDLLHNRISDNLSRYEGLLLTLEAIAKKELTGEPLTEEEYQTI